MPREVVVRGGRRVDARSASSRSAAAWASSPSASSAELGAEVVAVDISARMVELDARPRGRRAASPTSRSSRSRTASFDCVVATWMLYHVPDLDRGRRASSRASSAPAAGSSRSTNSATAIMQELWDLLGGEVTRRALVRLRERRGGARAVTSTQIERRDADGTVVVPRPGGRCSEFVGRDHDALRTSPTASPELTEPFAARRSTHSRLRRREAVT